VLLAVWIGLALALGAVLLGGWLALTHGLRAWRGSRRLMRQMTEGLDHVSRSVALTERKAAATAEKSAKLTAALERLQRSQAELAVLRAAAAEVSASPAIRTFFPRK
jgi:hypothetical protein